MVYMWCVCYTVSCGAWDRDVCVRILSCFEAACDRCWKREATVRSNFASRIYTIYIYPSRINNGARQKSKIERVITVLASWYKRTHTQNKIRHTKSIIIIHIFGYFSVHEWNEPEKNQTLTTMSTVNKHFCYRMQNGTQTKCSFLCKWNDFSSMISLYENSSFFSTLWLYWSKNRMFKHQI